MIITTTDSVDGYRIVNYFPPVVVSATVVPGSSSDVVKGVTDPVRDDAEAYQRTVATLHANALIEIESWSRQSGANAAVGARFEFSLVSRGGVEMCMLSAVATPVLIRTRAAIAEEAAAAATAAYASKARPAKAADQTQVDASEANGAAGNVPKKSPVRRAKTGTLAALLAEPGVLSSVGFARRVYGKSVAAEVLREKADELGYADLEIDVDEMIGLL